MRKADFSVLILEDDEDWRNRHYVALSTRGFHCIATGESEQAIRQVQSTKQNPPIRYALVDEILMVKKGPEAGFTQHMQGSDAVKVIAKYGVASLFITDAPRAKGTIQGRESIPLFTAQLRRLLALPEVLGVFHKHELETPEEQERIYDQIGDIIRNKEKADASMAGRDRTPKFFIGMMLDKDKFTEFVGRSGVKWLGVDELLRKAGVNRVADKAEAINQLLERSPVRLLFVQDGESRPLRRFSSYGPYRDVRNGTKYFEILLTWAIKQESGQDLIITDGEYGSPKSMPVEDQRPLADYGRGTGVSIRTASSPLATAVCRMRKLFRCKFPILRQGGRDAPFERVSAPSSSPYEAAFKPSFEIGLALMAKEEPRKRRSG